MTRPIRASRIASAVTNPTTTAASATTATTPATARCAPRWVRAIQPNAVAMLRPRIVVSTANRLPSTNSAPAIGANAISTSPATAALRRAAPIAGGPAGLVIPATLGRSALDEPDDTPADQPETADEQRPVGDRVAVRRDVGAYLVEPRHRA